MDEIFSSIDIVAQCLLDSKRTEAFKRVIEKRVKKGSVVLDSGTGSGILALFAANAGAKKVYSLEFDSYVADLARKNISENGFKDKIDVLVGDARNLELTEGIFFNIVIMEMLTTGMIDEHQIETSNNLLNRGYTDTKTIFIPQKQETFIAPVEYDFNNFGFEMKMVKHLWEFLPKTNLNYLAQQTLLNSISFDKMNTLHFAHTHVFNIEKSGILNGIYLTSRTWLDEEEYLDDTLALNGPVVHPLDQDIPVSKGDKIEIAIRYQFGAGYRNFKVVAKKL